MNFQAKISSVCLELELCFSERNPLIPAFSESAAVCYDPEKGRTIKARRDIKVGTQVYLFTVQNVFLEKILFFILCFDVLF